MYQEVMFHGFILQSLLTSTSWGQFFLCKACQSVSPHPIRSFLNPLQHLKSTRRSDMQIIQHHSIQLYSNHPPITSRPVLMPVAHAFAMTSVASHSRAAQSAAAVCQPCEVACSWVAPKWKHAAALVLCLHCWCILEVKHGKK